MLQTAGLATTNKRNDDYDQSTVTMLTLNLGATNRRLTTPTHRLEWQPSP